MWKVEKKVGLPNDFSITSAASNWIINNGCFAYWPGSTKLPALNLTGYKAFLLVNCEETATLQQDIWYMNLEAGVEYVLKFDCSISTPDIQSKICSGDPDLFCGDTLAEAALSINILDSTKAPVAHWLDGEAKPDGNASLTAVEWACGKTATVTPPGCVYPAGCAPEPGWKTFSYTFTVKRNLSPSIHFSIYKNIAKGLRWGIKNISLATKDSSARIGNNGFDIPSPIPTTPSVISGTDPSKYVQTWDFSTQASSSGGTVLEWLSELNNAKDNSDGRKVGGLFCLDQKGAALENLSVVQDDNQQVVCLKAQARRPDPAKPKQNAPAGAVLMTSEYYTSGVFDLWVKVTNVVDDKGNSVNNNDPVGCCFADWVFHYIDYSNTYDPRILLQPDPKRNAEIDIEIGANCPKNDKEYTYDVGRLNGWGGILGGVGGNFEMHTKMPCDSKGNQISLSDGAYHKLTFVLNTGADESNPTKRSNTRSPGYIKWYVDDILWGGGWLGGNYGVDNIPHTAMRFVFGPWFPVTWAGCVCPGDQTKPGVCDASSCNLKENNFIWDSADFYLKKASYTPLYSNGAKDQSNYMVPPAQDASGNPTTVEGPNPNRGMWLPASNPYVHFDPTCPNAPLMPSSIVKGISTQRKKTKGIDFDLDIDLDFDLDLDVDIDFGFDSNE